MKGWEKEKVDKEKDTKIWTVCGRQFGHTERKKNRIERKSERNERQRKRNKTKVRRRRRRENQLFGYKTERKKMEKQKQNGIRKKENVGIYFDKRSDVDEGTKRNLVKILEKKIEKITRNLLKGKLWTKLERNGYVKNKEEEKIFKKEKKEKNKNIGMELQVQDNTQEE